MEGLFFIYCSSLCGLHLFTDGEGQTEGLGGQVQFHFLAMGGCGSGGFQTKIGGVKAIFFFFYNLSPDYFFSNVRIRQEGGIVYRPIKKIQAGWAHGGFNKYLFLGFFSFDAVASVDVYLPAGKDKANLIFLPGGAVGVSKQI